MHVLYFAWLREKIGLAGEDLTPPPGVATARELLRHLAARGGGYGAAFANEAVIRCALDQEFVPLDTALGQAVEIAFFPPVTGG